jgi:Zn-dependent alcohol dehydrogenase
VALKAAFIFIAPNADPVNHRSVIETEQVTLITVGVQNYDSAVKEAVKLTDEGVVAIELCGGFGHNGTAMVSNAVKEKAVVGVVRFDHHPGLDNKSGDELF